MKLGLLAQLTNSALTTRIDNKITRIFNKVIRKVDSLCRDGRLGFMMKDWDGGDVDLLPDNRETIPWR